MPRYSELKETTNFELVSFFPIEKVKWCWINDYFDGPIEGIVEIDAKLYLCSMAEEVDDDKAEDWYRKYWLIELTSEQLEIEKYWHREFCKYVGTHFTCDENGKRRNGDAIQPKERWSGFYEPYKKKYNPDYGENTVIGWYKL